jgi:hypothetical protein
VASRFHRIFGALQSIKSYVRRKRELLNMGRRQKTLESPSLDRVKVSEPSLANRSVVLYELSSIKFAPRIWKAGRLP